MPALTPKAAPGAMSGSYDESAVAAEETTDSFWEVSPGHPLLLQILRHHHCIPGCPSGWGVQCCPPLPHMGISCAVAWVSQSALLEVSTSAEQWRGLKGVGFEQPHPCTPKVPSAPPILGQLGWSWTAQPQLPRLPVTIPITVPLAGGELQAHGEADR